MMRVLVVDDEPLAQTALANILTARDDVEHYDAAGDAIEALEKLSKQPYDVVLLDINMPEMSGTELVDQLKRRGDPLPRVVFVTAHDEQLSSARPSTIFLSLFPRSASEKRLAGLPAWQRENEPPS